MSWEDCGFKPGVIDGPAKCSFGECGECDGEHHFYVSNSNDEDEGVYMGTVEPSPNPEMFFCCKHCMVRATMVAEDESALDEDEMAIAAHESMYGDEEREMAERRREEYERDRDSDGGLIP